jgi:uncharacterized phage protein gp47/JayE
MPLDLPVSVPDFATIRSRVQADIASDMGEQDVYLRRTFARGAAYAMARAMHSLYGFGARVAAELHPVTAKSWGILIWAQLRGLTRTAATAATAQITIVHTGSATVPDGTVFVREDGAEYTLNTGVGYGPSGAGNYTGKAITASEAGSESSLDVGDTLTFQSPIANVSATVTVTSATSGADLETLPALKERMLANLSSPPQGGADADYVAWAKASNPEILRVWVYPHEPYMGQITVRFALRVPEGGDPTDVIPEAGDATALQAALRLRAPAHMADYVYAAVPTPRAIDIDVTLTPDTTEIREAITNELEDLFGTLDVEPGGILDEDDIRDAIRRGVKSVDADGKFVLNTIEGAPPADIDLADGVLPVLGVLTEDGGAWT